MQKEFITRLLELHKKLLPDVGSGNVVHDRNGCRTIAILTAGDGCEEKEGLRPDENGIKQYRVFQRETEMLQEVKSFVATCVGRNPYDTSQAIAMLSFQGQRSAQDWHQDAPGSKLAVLVYLSDGTGSTQFLDYHGLNIMCMRKENRMLYLKKQWSLLEPVESKTRSGRRRVALNEIKNVASGSVIVFNSSHIHRQPPPPKEGHRRTLYFYFKSGTARHDTDVETVKLDSWERSWENRHALGGVRK